MSLWPFSPLLLVPLFAAIGAIFLFKNQGLGPKGGEYANIFSDLLAVTGFTGIALLIFFPSQFSHRWIATSPPHLMLLSLILFLTSILTRFSRRYMAGDKDIARYYRWFFLTIAGVSLTVIANHLALFWYGWLSISLAFHKLITFYDNRPRALLAAHKKFILARTAELFLLVAFTLLYREHKTLFIDELGRIFLDAFTMKTSLTIADHAAAVLIAGAALIKCAQFPAHGWLIQVVEAPTPVSALLHAGIINLGGFLLILFAPLVMQSSLAQWIVLVVAGLGTVLSALIMTTRVSVKVRLAWSTSAQMGLMLVECALGLFELALLHLFAHSLYKVYAFLSSGEAVIDDLYQKLWPTKLSGILPWVVATSTSIAAVLCAYHLIGHEGPWSPWIIAAISLSLLWVQRQTFSSWLLSTLLGIMAMCLYGFQKIAFGDAVHLLRVLRESPWGGPDVWVALLFSALIVAHVLLTYRQSWRGIERFSIWLFAGFYLDEWFTRLTLRVWPIASNASEAKKRSYMKLQLEWLKGPTP
jgi:NAD(P)H-quinone oxidoreductase subunit 5